MNLSADSAPSLPPSQAMHERTSASKLSVTPPPHTHTPTQGLHERAVEYFRRALRLNPSYLAAWTLMGHEYMEMKNTAAAIGGGCWCRAPPTHTATATAQLPCRNSPTAASHDHPAHSPPSSFSACRIVQTGR